jgi:transglutaminase-like putative cysteine protease
MTANKLYYFLFCLFFLHVSAQKMELGKVSIAELEQKVHPTDTAAVAAVLFKKGKTEFNLNIEGSWSIVTKIDIKIKIYKKGGLALANQEVQYYIGGSGTKRENVTFSNACTYNLVDGKVQKTKLKSEGEFTKVINDNFKEKSITLPAVKEGSIIEFSYELNSPFITNFNDWEFQREIPINNVEYSVYIPKYFQYNTIITGYQKVKLVSAPINVSTYGEMKHTYTIQNVPALKDENFVNNVRNYTSILKFELASIQYPNESKKNVALDWEGVVKTIYEDEDFGPELKKTGYFEEDVKSIIAGLTKRDDIIKAIFDFVKAKIKWNENYGYYTKDGVKEAYKKKMGNVAEINLMLTAMLRYAGIDANPVLISTRSNGVAIFPNRTAYNYVISAVEIENDLILLDATEKFSAPNVLPSRDLNWFGRLIRKDGTSAEVELDAKKLSWDISNIAFSVASDGTINGKLRRQLSDHEALFYRQKYVGLSLDNYLEKLESKNNNIEIFDYKRENELDISKQVVELYSFKDSKSIEIIADKMYISPLLFLSPSENPFKQEKREYPIDFGFPREDKYNVTIEIPDGYVIESMPSSVNLTTGDSIGTFKYIIANTGNKIQVQLTTDINLSIVPTEYYEVLKEFFKKMIDKQNEKIVLKKV